MKFSKTLVTINPCQFYSLGAARQSCKEEEDLGVLFSQVSTISQQSARMAKKDNGISAVSAVAQLAGAGIDCPSVWHW